LSLKYNQQDATFSRSIYFYKLLYMYQAVPPPIIRNTKLHIQRQVLSNQYCCLLLSWMRRNAHHQEHKTVHTASGIARPILLPAAIVDEMERSSVSSTMAAVLVWQYLTLYVQFCASDDGRRNRLKHTEQFIKINRSRNVAS
jgi:hypothetical protein